MSRSLHLVDELSQRNNAPSPFLLQSREEMPMNLLTALDYCRFLYYSTPQYQSVTTRIVGHFVTRLDYRGDVGSPKERTEFSQFFTEELNGLNMVREAGAEYSAYGNGFVRIHFPFVRMLVDRRSSLRTYALSMFPAELTKFDLQTLTYEVPDPTREDLSVDKRPKIKLPPRDTPGKDFSKIRLRKLDPRYCKLLYSECSGKTLVQYSFTPDQKAKVKRGVLHEVNETPLVMLRAMRDNGEFLFNEDSVYHLKTPSITGVSNEGWGIPMILTQFPTIHKIAVYDRMDEAIGMEYLMPIRLMAPNLEGLGDHRNNVIADEWVPAVQSMLAEQRADRTRIHGFPFPFVYQELGGQGKSLTPKDLKEFEVRNLMNGLGYPLELFQATMGLQQMPAAIRLFESSFAPLSSGLSGLARWSVKKISAYMNGEAYDSTLQSPSVADDLEHRSLLMNLFSAGEVPGRVALESLSLGSDRVKLKVERAQEEAELERQLAELAAEEQRRAQLGSLTDMLEQGQAEGGQSGAAPSQTPTDMRDKAQQLAQQWLAIPEDGKRSQAMAQVRSVDPDLYAVAKDVMEQMRRDGASQGRQMAAQQAQQQAGAAPPQG